MTVPKIKRYHYRCYGCDGANLQAQTWFYLNSDPVELCSGDPPHDDVWCEDCNTEVSTYVVNEYEDGKFALDGQPDKLFDSIEAAVAAFNS